MTLDPLQIKQDICVDLIHIRSTVSVCAQFLQLAERPKDFEGLVGVWIRVPRILQFKGDLCVQFAICRGLLRRAAVSDEGNHERLKLHDLRAEFDGPFAVQGGGFRRLTFELSCPRRQVL